MWSTQFIFIILEKEEKETKQHHLLGKRRMTASSRSNGRFVAPRMRILWLSLDLSPSHAAINSFLILRVASCSKEPPRAPSKLSTYIIQSQTIFTITIKVPSSSDDVYTFFLSFHYTSLSILMTYIHMKETSELM